MAEPILGMRFSVLFMAGGAVANPIDLRFRRVSGLAVEVETEAQPSGGCNTYQQPLPKAVRHGNLVLERGLALGSPLTAEFNASLSSFKFLTSNVLVTLLSADSLPLAAWLFMKAWPVKWATSDLDAGEPGLVIDTLELAYTRMQPMRL
ncbi:phage tail protein [Ideonella sp. DXS22W]|uniref:Phage tail protein n=1 Tax=Pseudaquabacterium inlustre TaxID=2984192 RepID=A0ABU9CC21_9BURK